MNPEAIAQNSMNATGSIDIVAQFIVSNSFISEYCIFIIILALSVYCIGFRRKIILIITSMREALAKIRELPGLESFYGHFSQFDNWTKENSLLSHLWCEFRETLVMPSSVDEHKVIRNTSEASCCFNDHNLSDGKIDFRFYSAFPNYLTGLGILGTFIGLVAGIYLAGKGLASSDTEVMNEGLKKLLQGASLAFLTSITGMLTSMVFSWKEKHDSHILNRLISDWNKELDSRIERVTPERLASEQLEELKQQTGYQEEFATQVAFNISEAIGQLMQERLVPGIADAFEKRVSEKLVPAISELIDAVQGMRQDRGDTNENMLQQVVSQFSQAMEGAAGKEMGALSETFAGLHGVLVPLLSSMHDANSTMRDNATFISDRIKNTFSESNKVFSNGVEKAMDDLKAAVAGAGESFNASLKGELGALISELKGSQQSMHDSVSRLLERFEQAASSSSQAFSEGTGKAIQQLEKGISEAGSLLHGELRDAFGHAVDRLDKATQGLDTVLDGIRNAGGNINDTVRDTGELLQSFGKATRDFADIESRLSGSLQSLERTAQSIKEGGDSAKTALAQVQKGTDALRQSVENFQQMHNAVRHSLEGYAENLEGLDAALEKVFENMQQGQMAYADSTTTYMSELDKQAAKVTDAFAGAVAAWSDTLEDLAESAQSMAESMNSARNRR